MIKQLANDDCIRILYDLADALHVELLINRYPNQDNRFSAKFDRCEYKEGGCLVGTYGNGKTPDDSVSDYYYKIKGKLLVFDAMRESRREVYFPG